MDDRTMLELAAKAAGYPISQGYFEAAKSPNAWWGWIYVDGDGEPSNDSAWTELWNPLTDDGDALRMAVKLNFSVFAHPTKIGIGQYGGGTYLVWQERGLDSDADYRRAITRAAAEIGKQMEGGEE
jgi:NADH:ubiquinone oxidoreductase subunit